MARIIYALSGQGRGHTSRVMAVSEALRRSGHEIVFCCGGTAQDILEAQGEHVIEVPALRQVVEANKVCFVRTIRSNWKTILKTPSIVARLAEQFKTCAADLLITDFEAFSPRAARRIGLPILSFNHQQIVTETSYDLPLRHWPTAALTAAAIRLIAPRRPEHLLLTSFFFPPLRAPERTTLVPPIIRPAVQALRPTRGEKVLVYYNQAAGADRVIEALSQVDAPFVLYNFDPPAPAPTYDNLEFKQPSLEGFLEDLAASRAVICTAGFTLISEALYLDKPLLVVPNRGIFEQILNARFLEREQLGEAVIDRPLTARDVRGFLERSERYQTRLMNHEACGNQEAVACIEQLLTRITGASSSRPAVPQEEAAPHAV